MIRENGNAPQLPAPLTNGRGSGELVTPGGMFPADPRGWGHPPPKPTANTIDPKGLLRAFQRRWFLAISLGLFLGVCAAAIAYYVTPAPYSTFAELRISSVQGKLLFETAEQRASFDVFKQTQSILVTSPFVLNAALRDPEVAKCSIIRQQAQPVQWLEDQIRVSSPAMEFIRVSLEGEEPRELALVLNAVMKAYIEESVDKMQKERRERLEKLAAVQRQIEEELRAKHKALENLAGSLKAGNTTQVDAKVAAILDLSVKLRMELTRVTFELLRNKYQLASRKAENFSEQIAVPDVMIDAEIAQEPEYKRLEETIANNEAYLIELQKTVRFPNDARVVAKKQQIEQDRRRLADLRGTLRKRVEERLKGQIAAQLAANDAAMEQQIAAMEQEKAALEKELAELKIEEGQTGVLSFEMQTLADEIEQSSGIGKTIADEIQRLNIELETPIGINIHRHAEVPLERDMVKKYRMAGMAGLGLFGLLAGGVVWLEYLTRRISSTDEVANELSLRVVGALPLMPRSVIRGHGRQRPKTAYWHSVLTESIDAARTVLLRDAKVEAMNSVMICSAVGGEGKTTLSCHLATSLARAGRNVVLVDCDIRRPSVHRVFDVPNTPGLCDVLRGDAKLESVIQPVALSGLSILPAGKVNQEVLRLLAQDGMDPILEQLKQQYDFIVVDSSPVLPVTDALLVAPHVDAVMFSIRRDISRMSKVAAAYQRLNMLGVPILGAVVIGLDDGSYSYRYPYKYGYGYRNTYQMQSQP